MVSGNLDTTNLLLGMMAAVSVLEALLLVVVAIAGYRLYAQTTQTVREIEQRQIAPLVAQVSALMVTVNGILADVRDVTARVTHQAERVDSAIHHTMDRVDETTGRVRQSVAQRVRQIVGLAQWAKHTMESIFNGRRHEARRHA